jgi:hypothetical protein
MEENVQNLKIGMFPAFERKFRILARTKICRNIVIYIYIKKKEMF